MFRGVESALICKATDQVLIITLCEIHTITCTLLDWLRYFGTWITQRGNDGAELELGWTGVSLQL